jgi:hypothetical protein
METISNIAVKDDLEISGNINGTAIIKTWVNLLFYYWLDCRSIFKKDTIGTLTIHVDNKAANTYNTSVSITGQDNLVYLNGTYKTGDGNLQEIQISQNWLAICSLMTSDLRSPHLTLPLNL